MSFSQIKTVVTVRVSLLLDFILGLLWNGSLWTILERYFGNNAAARSSFFRPVKELRYFKTWPSNLFFLFYKIYIIEIDSFVSNCRNLAIPWMKKIVAWKLIDVLIYVPLLLLISWTKLGFQLIRFYFYCMLPNTLPRCFEGMLHLFNLTSSFLLS